MRQRIVQLHFLHHRGSVVLYAKKTAAGCAARSRHAMIPFPLLLDSVAQCVHLELWIAASCSVHRHLAIILFLHLQGSAAVAVLLFGTIIKLDKWPWFLPNTCIIYCCDFVLHAYIIYMLPAERTEFQFQ